MYIYYSAKHCSVGFKIINDTISKSDMDKSFL